VVGVSYESVAKHDQSIDDLAAGRQSHLQQRYTSLIVRLARESLKLDPPPSNQDKGVLGMTWRGIVPLLSLKNPNERALGLQSLLLRRAIAIMSYRFEGVEFRKKKYTVAVENFSAYYIKCFLHAEDLPILKNALLGDFEKMQRLGHEDKAEGIKSQFPSWNAVASGRKVTIHHEHITKYLAIVGALLCSIASLAAELLGHSTFSFKFIQLSVDDLTKGQDDVHSRFNHAKLWWISLLEAGILEADGRSPKWKIGTEAVGHFEATNMVRFFDSMTRVWVGDKEVGMPTQFTRLHALFSMIVIYGIFRQESWTRKDLQECLSQFRIHEQLQRQVIAYLESIQVTLPPPPDPTHV